MTKHCLNCGHQVKEKFCPQCGQRTEVIRITFPHLVSEAVHTFTHFDKGFLFTLKELTIHPGSMQRSYLNGQRGKYQKPFSMFFICATITALALYFIDKPTDGQISQLEEMRGHFLRHYYVFTQLALLPFYALVTWIMFRSNQINYAESLVLFTYALSFLLLLVVFINTANSHLSKISPAIIEIPILFVYLLWTSFRFFDKEKKWKVFLKSLVVILAGYYASNYAGNEIVHFMQQFNAN